MMVAQLQGILLPPSGCLTASSSTRIMGRKSSPPLVVISQVLPGCHNVLTIFVSGFIAAKVCDYVHGLEESEE